MARRVVGYAGSRPIYEDDGPARGRVGSADSEAMSRLGAATIPSRLLVSGLSSGESGGNGEVERRQATEAELAAMTTRDAARRSSLHVVPARSRQGLTPAEHLARSRHRGAQRAGFVTGATKPWLQPPSPRQPSPPTAADPSPPRRIPVVEAPLAPQLVSLPSCGTCLHEAVCRIRPLLPESSLGLATALDLPAGVSVSIKCGHYLFSEPMPAETAQEGATTATPPVDAVATVAAAGRPGPGRGGRGAKLSLDPDVRDALVLEAVRATGSTAAAGRQIGVSGTRVQQLVRAMRREGRLPDDVDALMRARKARGRAASADVAVPA